MLDTPDHISKKQFEILVSKTSDERFFILDRFIDFGRMLVESNIKHHNPNISELNLKIAVFKRNYSTYFSNDEMEKIIASLTDFYNKSNQMKA